MIRCCIRFPEETVKTVKRMSNESNTAESDVWRSLVNRGLEQERQLQTNITTETLCLARRIAEHMGHEVLDSAKEDAKELIQKIRSHS